MGSAEDCTVVQNIEIRPGYKLTEVGVIPDDWDVDAFGKLYAEPSRNGIYKSAEYQGRGIRIVNMGEMFGLDFISNQEMSRISLTPKEIATTGLRDGDLLFGRRSVVPAGAGKCSIVITPPEPVTFESSIIRVRLNKAEVDPLFHYYFFASSLGRTVMSNIISGTNIKGIRGTELRELKIPRPPLPEQRSLAQALSDVDALIAALDKLIAKKRHLKTATMQQLLTGKKRLLGFGEGKGYKQTAIGMIPEDWNVRCLGEVGQSLIGLTYRPEDTRDYGTLVLRSSNVQNDRLAYENNVYVDSAMPLPSRVIVEEGDILICVRNGSKQLIGKCALIDAEAAGSAFGAFMSVFRTKISSFVFYQFQSDVIQTQINEIMGATINQITNKDMAAFQIPLPQSDEEQREIANVLSDMDAEIAALETRLAKTQALKQGMMQELLTGKTRLV